MINKWEDIADAIITTAKKAVVDVANIGAQNVQDQIAANSQVRTGFMMGSVYASTSDGSDYSNGSDERSLPEVKPESDMEAIVGVGAKYAIFPNYGTMHQGAKPFFEPAILKTQDDLDQAVVQIKIVIEKI